MADMGEGENKPPPPPPPPPPAPTHGIPSHTWAWLGVVDLIQNPNT